MRRLAIALMILSAVSGCRKEPVSSSAPPVRTSTSAKAQDLSNAKVDMVIAPQVTFLEKSSVGSALDAAGNVVASQTAFRQGDPIYLTMWLKESPDGLQTSVRWYNADRNKELARDQKAMNGGKIATFRMPTSKVDPGKYRVEGYWGGNLACEIPFEINGTKAPAKGAKKK